MDQDIRRKTLQNFNERSNKAIDAQPFNINKANPIDESPGRPPVQMSSKEASANKQSAMDESSPYYRDKGQS